MKGPYIVIIILSGVILVGIGYFIGQNDSDANSNKSTKAEEHKSIQEGQKIKEEPKKNISTKSNTPKKINNSPSPSEKNVQIQKDENVDANSYNMSDEDWMNMGNNGGTDINNEINESNGFGNGSSGGGPRIMYGNPASCLNSTSEEGKVYLILWVNQHGKIVKAVNNAAKSTTASKELINMSIDAVKRCVYFDKRPGTTDEKIVLSKPIVFRHK